MVESLGDWSPSIEITLKLLSQAFLWSFFNFIVGIFKSVKT